MTRRKIPPLEKGEVIKEIKKQAEVLLASIAHSNGMIGRIHSEYEAKIARINDECKERLLPVVGALQADEKALVSLIKKNKAILFDGTDVVNLPPGSLIHGMADRVIIPHTALNACEEQGFFDVIKIAKSLDRAAIEKWPDAKLVLIGAERTQKEEFNYDLRLRKD